MLLGILGSLLPVVPGLPLSWLGLLLLYLTSVVPIDWWVLGSTLAIVIFITLLDYSIPSIGAKALGGTQAGVWGASIGMVVALIFPILGPLGFIVCPFLGAMIGELMGKKTQKKVAFKAAFGTFLGFLAGTFVKLLVSVSYAIGYLYITVQYAEDFFTFV